MQDEMSKMCDALISIRHKRQTKRSSKRQKINELEKQVKHLQAQIGDSKRDVIERDERRGMEMKVKR